MNDVVGSASFELRATKEKLGQDIKSAETDLKQFGDKAERDLGGSASRIGAGIGRMAGAAVAAVASLVTVLGLAVAGAFSLGLAGQKMGADIADAAKRIGIGTDALQEWRFVAKQAGEDASAADRALESFAKKLAQATAGTSKEASKGFSLIGIGPEQLRSFKSTEEALDKVTDRIKDLSSEAQRAAVVEALGLGPLSAALIDAGTDVAALRDEARSLGVVMDQEMIQRASKAQKEFDTLAQIIDVELKSAFIDLAPVLLGAINLIAEAVRQLSLFVDKFRELENRTSAGLQDERARLVADRDAIAGAYGTAPLDGRPVIARPVPGVEYDRPTPRTGPGGRGAPVLPSRERRPGGNVILDAGEHFDLAQARIAEIDGILAARARASAPQRTDFSGGSSITLPPERTRVDRSAEREARRAERVEQEIYRARQRLLNVAEGDLLTARERYDLARDQLSMDREARDAEIASKEARGEYKKAEADRLRLANEEADALEDRILVDNSIRDIRDEELANARILADLTADLISLQVGAARTARERGALELELLAIAQKQRRDALDVRLNNTPGLTDAERQTAWDQNRRVEEAERAAVARANMTPLEQWRDASLRTADEIAEAYENVAARGLDSLNAGLVDAILNSRSLGEVFHNVARQIMADLLAISVRRGITEPLANMLFPSGSSGGQGGGVLSSIGSFLGNVFGGGRASGGPMMGGNWYRVGEHGPEDIVMPRDGFAIPAGALAGAGGGASIAQRSPVVKLFLDEGGLFKPRVEGIAGPIAVETGSAAYSGARETVPAEMAMKSRYTRGRK